MKILTQIWQAIKAFFGRPGDPPPEPVETPPFQEHLGEHSEVRISPKVIEAIQNPPLPRESIGKAIRDNQARRKNMERRTKFAHAEHFKRRQPTTARKLWNPQAKVDED